MKEINISERLTALRTEKGITQGELADALGISNKSVSKWENGASSPDLNMLAALAEFYEVSVDYLLGIESNGKQSAEELLNEEFGTLTRIEMINKSFDLSEMFFPHFLTAENGDISKIIPKSDQPARTSVISCDALYNLLINSEDINLSVMLYKNKSNFKWLKDEDSLKRIAKLLTFLADVDTLKIVTFIHSWDCSGSFTAAYIAKNAGISVTKAEEILENAVEVRLCGKSTAHLKSGDMTVYTAGGSGSILTILTLAYEHMIPYKSYYYGATGPCKMIEGDKK